jgi:putative Mg2+ transporter-C (MgtC) family protein
MDSFFVGQWYFLLVIVMSLILGGLLGLDREYRQRPFGFKLSVLVCVGAALLAFFAGAQVILAIGLLGCGSLAYSRRFRLGLRHALAIWVAGVVGVFVGCEMWQPAVFVTFLSVAISFLSRVLLKSSALQHQYSMTFDVSSLSSLEKFEDVVKKFVLDVEDKRLVKDDKIHVSMTYSATALTQHLFLKRVLHLYGVENVVVF